VDYMLSVFRLFAELFPEFTNTSQQFSSCHRLNRLHFNKIGFEIYGKVQSRRVPALSGKPGNPGYGFRRARWRNPIDDPQDASVCGDMLMGIGVSNELERVKKRVRDFHNEWDMIRRPTNPAGPGRPRSLNIRQDQAVFAVNTPLPVTAGLRALLRALDDSSTAETLLS